jgi:predicted molibdopterin-dependent oxidoreductase YjgC
LVVWNDHRLVGAVDRGWPVTLLVDGEPVPAFEGETVSAALLAIGRRGLRVAPRLGGPRGMYCGIGLCFECVMSIDGQRVRACQTPVRDGMLVGGAP